MSATPSPSRRARTRSVSFASARRRMSSPPSCGWREGCWGCSVFSSTPDFQGVEILRLPGGCMFSRVERACRASDMPDRSVLRRRKIEGQEQKRCRLSFSIADHADALVRSDARPVFATVVFVGVHLGAVAREGLELALGLWHVLR